MQLLGPAISGFLEPYFAYSRATHLDLLDLSYGSDREALLDMLQRAEGECGAALLRDVIAELGWRSINEGLIANRQIGLRIGGSFPLLVSPAEAALVEECGDTSRVSDRFLFVACGASPPAAGPPLPITELVNRFRACSLRHADLLADLLDVAPLTIDKVRRMLRLGEEVVDDFQALFASVADEGAAVAVTFRALKADIERELVSSVDGRRGPGATVRGRALVGARGGRRGGDPRGRVRHVPVRARRGGAAGHVKPCSRSSVPRPASGASRATTWC